MLPNEVAHPLWTSICCTVALEAEGTVACAVPVCQL